MITGEQYHQGSGARLYEAEIFPASGQQLEYRNSIQEWLMDDSFTILNSENIQQLLYLYDTDPGIRTAAHIHNSSVFSGGIVFQKRDGSKLTPTAQKWYDATWMQWCTNLIRQEAALGFSCASFVANEQYIGVPVVLDLHKVTILYKVGVDGFPHFVFLENVGSLQDIRYTAQARQNGGFSVSLAGNASMLYRYIPNVVVYVSHAPSSMGGELRSKVSILGDDMSMDDLLTNATKTATHARSNPPFVLESIQERYDPDAVVSTIQPHSMLLGNGSGPDLGDTDPTDSYNSSSSSSNGNTTTMSIGNQKELEQKQYEYAKMLAATGSGGMQNATQLALQHMRAIALSGTKEYYVGEGKRYVKHTLPEGPGDFLLQFRHDRLERTFMIFGIPLSMISQQSSLGGKTSMNENAMTVFDNTQKQTKQYLICCMDNMYGRIYSRHHLLHRLVDTPLGELNAKFNDHHGVNIIMPGLPSDDTTNQLYMMGVLKYEAYVKFMAAKHSIPEDDFNPAPLVSLDDLNGIKPDAPTTGSKSKK